MGHLPKLPSVCLDRCAQRWCGAQLLKIWPTVKYPTQKVQYWTYICILPIYDSLHNVPILYTICAFTPCKWLPKCSPYTPYTLDINHLEPHKHCPCRMLLGTPGHSGGGNHLAGVGWGLVIPAHVYIYIYRERERRICVYIYVHYIYIYIVYIHIHTQIIYIHILNIYI